MIEKIYNVLFLCTGNSARSVLAEGLLNVMGHGRFRAYSAGSMPTGRVNPFAIELLDAIGYDTRTLRSKSWDEFGAPDAPPMDFIITVCDNAAGEVCPIWPGHPTSAHWGFADPAVVAGSDADKREAFSQTLQQIRSRLSLFLSLPLSTLDTMTLQQKVREIGQP